MTPTDSYGTPNDPDVMKQAYESGVSIADIAANAGLSYSWARRKLLKAGVDLTPRSPRDSPVPLEQLAKEYRAGDSILTIANRHDLSFRRIRNLLLQQGVKLRLSTKAHKEQTQRSPAPRLGDNDAPGVMRASWVDRPREWALRNRSASEDRSSTDESEWR